MGQGAGRGSGQMQRYGNGTAFLLVIQGNRVLRPVPRAHVKHEALRVRPKFVHAVASFAGECGCGHAAPPSSLAS